MQDNDNLVEVQYDINDYKVVLFDNKKLDIDIVEYIDFNRKYDDYLQIISTMNNFITNEHMVLLLNGKVGRTKVYKDLADMCEVGLLRKEYIGKYIYYILSKKGQIILKSKNNVGHIRTPNENAIKKNLYFGDYFTHNLTSIIDLYLTRIEENELKVWISGMGILWVESLESFRKAISMNLYYELLNDNNKSINKEVVSEQHNITTQLEEVIKGKGYSRKVRKYDVINKLSLKGVYCFKWAKHKGIYVVQFLILDLDRDINWYKKTFLDIDKCISMLHNTLDKPMIKYKIVIQTDCKSNKERLEVKLENIINKYLEIRNNLIKRNTRGGYLILEYKDMIKFDTLWNFIDFKVIEYNTIRFFETRSDKLPIVDKSDISYISLKVE